MKKLETYANWYANLALRGPNYELGRMWRF